VIDYFQSQRAAETAGVPPETIEKDYFIELMLFYFAKDSKLKEKLIFRRGTALRKIYFSDYRFSEDLDFLVERTIGILFLRLRQIPLNFPQFPAKIR